VAGFFLIFLTFAPEAENDMDNAPISPEAAPKSKKKTTNAKSNSLQCGKGKKKKKRVPHL